MRLLDETTWATRAATWTAVEYVLSCLERSLGYEYPSDDSTYGWEPNSLINFFAGLAACREHTQGNKLLIVGSGLGRFAALAGRLGWLVKGIEIRASFTEISHELYPEIPVQVADAFDYDEYDQFDVVYYYRPLVSSDEQAQLNSMIISRMRPGALLFASGGPDPVGLEPIGYQVWRI